MGGGAWPFLVRGLIRLVDSDNERDQNVWLASVLWLPFPGFRAETLVVWGQRDPEPRAHSGSLPRVETLIMEMRPAPNHADCPRYSGWRCLAITGL